MKYLGFLLGGIIGLVLLVYLIGLFLPVSHSATVNRIYEASPGEIWSAITGVDQFSEWRSSVSRVEVLSAEGDPLRWREHYTDNDPITFAELERQDSVLFVARIADEDLPFGGRWSYRLEETAGGTRLTITEDGEIYNAIFRFVARFIMGYTSTMETYLDDLEGRGG